MHARAIAVIELAAFSPGLTATDASAELPSPVPHDPAPEAREWVRLGCRDPGSPQDTAKTPLIKNTTRAAIPRGRSLLWKASDGDSGGVTLGQDLVPSDSVKGTGKPARAPYTCSASFYAGLPDLSVTSARLEGRPSAVVHNTNSWIDAGPTRVKFELVRCAADAVIAVKNVGPLLVAAGAKQTFTAAVTKPYKAPPSYWRITVDSERRVAESNERNNVWSNASGCRGRQAHSPLASGGFFLTGGEPSTGRRASAARLSGWAALR